MQASDLLTQGDGLSRALAWLLLAMSVASWVVILWKGWLLHRARNDLARACAAFWQAPSLAEAQQRVAGFDRAGLLLPLVQAATAPAPGSLDAQADAAARITRQLRDALHRVLRQLHAGQVLLATVGATAPFVGLLGTVWGIYHALTGLTSGGGVTIDRIAGPVGEALVMTAAGLAVAIPAVVAYNWLGRLIDRIEADLEGFAHDLRAWLAGSA
ncbi:MAG: MotA/TolQ/ExbB proton channel family protein [Burkholderiaceae bacterium]|jgi:biopolymer transport protein ExbB